MVRSSGQVVRSTGQVARSGGGVAPSTGPGAPPPAPDLRLRALTILVILAVAAYLIVRIAST